MVRAVSVSVNVNVNENVSGEVEMDVCLVLTWRYHINRSCQWNHRMKRERVGCAGEQFNCIRT